LYVAQSDPARPIWMAFNLTADHRLTGGREIGNAKKNMDEYPGLPDGMAVHASGAVFGSGPGGIYVMSPEGKLLGRIVTGGRTSNCTFDDGFRTLYITADDKICRLKL
ncbi:MAG: SMP-30/gluconolactonase/LRE family protein, partial [Planctomycetota bacterium]